MQFSSTLIAAIAFGMASAVQFTNSAFNGITAGESIELTWSDASGPVTITLKNGPSTALNTVSTVASGQTGTSFTWAVPSTLTQDTYALEITDSTAVPNYSPQFELVGGAAASSSVSASASSSSSSAVSSVSSVTSSASSSVSSVISSVSSFYESLTANSANSTTSTAAPSTTGATNGTVSTGKPSTTGGAGTTGSRTSSAGASTSTAVVPNSNSASDLASPLALVFLTFAAIFTLN